MTEKKAAPDKSPDKGLKFINDVFMEMTVELGRGEVTIAEIVKWTKGTVIELDKEKGVALDIYANKNSIGRGEAVVVNDKFGVRVTEVACPDGLLDDLA